MVNFSLMDVQERGILTATNLHATSSVDEIMQIAAYCERRSADCKKFDWHYAKIWQGYADKLMTWALNKEKDNG